MAKGELIFFFYYMESMQHITGEEVLWENKLSSAYCISISGDLKKMPAWNLTGNLFHVRFTWRLACLAQQRHIYQQILCSCAWLFYLGIVPLPVILVFSDPLWLDTLQEVTQLFPHAAFPHSHPENQLMKDGVFVTVVMSLPPAVTWIPRQPASLALILIRAYC